MVAEHHQADLLRQEAETQVAPLAPRVTNVQCAINKGLWLA